MRSRAYWRRLAAWLVDAACRLVPRDAALIAVGGGKGLRYADNSMHFFRACAHRGRPRVVWLTRSRTVRDEVRSEGLEAHLIASLRGLWLGARAAWHAFDVAPSDTGPTSRAARRLNLWHGIPLKDISFLRAGVERRSASMQGEDWLLHTTLGELGKMTSAFPVPPERVIIANLPRNDLLVSPPPPRLPSKPADSPWLARVSAMRAAGTRIVGYFPTWREGGADRFLGCKDIGELTRLLRALEERGMAILTKWHACSYAAYRHAGRSQAVEDTAELLSGSRQIVALPFGADLNSFLPSCDVLVTDYSSVFFDFLWLDRPIVFNPYDLDEYARTVGFNYDYETFVPGPIARDTESVLAHAGDTGEAYREKRRSMRERFFDEPIGTESILQRLGFASPGGA